MALTPEDVVNQKFTITKFRDGYDLDQVDDFLDAIVEELRQHEQVKAELESQVAELTKKLEACERRAEQLASAEREGDEEEASDQTIVVDAPAQSEKPEAEEPKADEPATEPDAIKSSAMLQLALELHDKHVHEGETTRDRLIREGQQKHDELVSEAEDRRASELAKLADERTDVEDRIKELRSYESEYRTTLRSYIQAQLRSLDGSPEPAGGPDLP